jgi:hypothetical protein
VSAPGPRNPNLAAEVVAANLRVDSNTAEVLRAFDASGVESLLVKGPSVARWIYDNSEPRGYADCDLLVSPPDLTTAEKVLAELGFEPEVDRHRMPDWWQEHAVAWVRERDGSGIDLHETLPGVGVDPDELWLTLAEHRETIGVGGYPAQTLTTPGRAFMLALHAAHHGVGWGQFMEDLERGTRMVGFETWRAAAEIAQSLNATATFAGGLRLVEPGRSIASELGLPSDGAVDMALKASTPPPLALGFERLGQTKGVRARLALVRHKVFPPVTFMRRYSPRAATGRRALLRAYVRRWRWLLVHAPAGFRAWRSARRNPHGD